MVIETSTVLSESSGNGAASLGGKRDDEKRIPESVMEELNNQAREVEMLGQQLKNQLFEVHKLQDTFESSMRKYKKMISNTQKEYKAQRKELAMHKALTHDLNKLMPTSGGFFVESFLGNYNVRFHRKKESLSFKEDYELFKQRLAPTMIIFCLICLYFPENRWIHMLFQLLLAYYYVNLSLRENILQKNGSNIKHWWIAHHYISMMAAVFMLTWPSSPSYTKMAKLIHLFGLYMGVAQFFQTRYQLARLYTLRSLGRASELDVSNSDSTQIHWSRGMNALLPIIIGGQLFQGYVSLTLFRTYSMFQTEHQILVCGLFFFAMFLGNMSTTIITILEKKGVIKKRKD